MKNKILSLIITSMLILNFFIIASNLAQADIAPVVPGIPSGLQPDNIEQKKVEIEGRWDYLKREWKNMLLQNKVVSAINSFFSKFNIVFRILFNENYDFSATLAIIIILWLFIAVMSAQIMRAIGLLNEGLSYLFGVAISVIFAHITILKIVADIVIGLVMDREMWWARMIVMIIFFGILGGLTYLEQKLAKYLKEMKEMRKKGETTQYQREIKGYTEKMKKTGKFNDAGAGI